VFRRSQSYSLDRIVAKIKMINPYQLLSKKRYASNNQIIIKVLASPSGVRTVSLVCQE